MHYMRFPGALGEFTTLSQTPYSWFWGGRGKMETGEEEGGRRDVQKGTRGKGTPVTCAQPRAPKQLNPALIFACSRDAPTNVRES